MATRKKVNKKIIPTSERTGIESVGGVPVVAATKAKVLSARDLRINQSLTPVFLPDLGGVVYKRELPASVMIDRPAVADPADPIQQQNTVSYFICKSIVDEHGNQIFADDEAPTLRDTLSISTYTILTQAVTGSSGAPGTAGLSSSKEGEGALLPNGSTSIRSSGSPTDSPSN